LSSHREFVEVEKTDHFRRNAPVIRLKAAGDSLFISEANALPLFHQHSHENDGLDPSEDISEQTRNVMENLTWCLKAAGRPSLFVGGTGCSGQGTRRSGTLGAAVRRRPRAATSARSTSL
jgi:hypothetical protein